MVKNFVSKEYAIDAADKAPGRLASKISKIIQGKNMPNYRKNVAYPAKIKIINASKIKINPKKFKEETFTSFSGYHSGLKKISFEKVFAKNPSLFLRKIIKGMLPDNKLQKIYLKNLTIEN